MPASKASAVKQLKTALAESSRLLHLQDMMMGIWECLAKMRQMCMQESQTSTWLLQDDPNIQAGTMQASLPNFPSRELQSSLWLG